MGVFYLPASGRAIVTVLALGPSRAGVVGAMAQLADLFIHQIHAVGVALGQMAAAKVAGQFVVDLQPPALDEFLRLADTAKAVGFELDQDGVGEGVIAGNQIDVLGRSRSSPAIRWRA